jgi:hypothetical protein
MMEGPRSPPGMENNRFAIGAAGLAQNGEPFRNFASHAATKIKGDYGLGYWENGGVSGPSDD